MLAAPALGTADVAPRGALTISANGGTITSLSFTNTNGTVVKGSLSTDRKSWTLGEPLGYAATYQVSGTAAGAGGTTRISGTYTTVSPDDTIHASIFPGDGDTVGVAQPVQIALGTDVTDPAARAAIEKAITVTTSPKTEGSFAWIQHDDGIGLDWRPATYFKSGTKVTVTANLYGVNMGENLWGEKDLSSSFTIGRNQVVKGDIKTHRLQVFRDGKLVADYPTSFGLESDPGRVTPGGTYVVMSKEYLHLMSNPRYGYKNFKAYYAVRISNAGIFIHANDGTDDIQGYENETHGCANLSTENAKAYYDTALVGDPVEITGSSQTLGPDQGDDYDWSFSYDQWKNMGTKTA